MKFTFWNISYCASYVPLEITGDLHANMFDYREFPQVKTHVEHVTHKYISAANVHTCTVPAEKSSSLNFGLFNL